MDITGTIGNDTLIGSVLRDDITGRDGNDLLLGEGGNDDLNGGAGNDTLDGGAGNDDMNGGAGSDLFIASAGNDSIWGFGAGDRIQLSGFSTFDQVLSAARSAELGDSTLLDLGGGNTLLLEDIRLGQLTASMFGFADTTPPTDPAPGRTLNGTAGNDDITGGAGDDQISGRAGNDDLNGAAGNDSISGGGGRDDITGGLGNDVLNGDAGNDDLYGAAGNDILSGGAGNDMLTGGTGNDTFIFTRGADRIEDFGDGDVIQLDAALGITSFAQVAARMQIVGAGDDTLIDFGGGNRLVIENLRPAQLAADDFLLA